MSTALTVKNVYCYQVGSTDCYKIGQTKNEPHKRKPGLSVGSSMKLRLYRTVETQDATGLEQYIHQLLGLKRAENGEFFHVSQQELNDAVDEAVAFVEKCRPLLHEAKKLCRKRPNGTMLDPSDDMLEAYRELREAGRQKFLLERRIEFLESKVQIAIGENLGISGVASWEWRDRWTMNIDLFKKEQLKLYEKYKRDSGGRRFSLERVDLTKRARTIAG